MTLHPLCFLIFVLIFSNESRSQDRYTVASGSIYFTSNSDLEVIKASSDNLTGLINPHTNQFAFKVRIATFQGFNSTLQRDHFNDKYMESDRFPEATFSGKIIEQINFEEDGTYEVRVKGDLDIHGVKQSRIVKSTLVLKNGILAIESFFKVPLSDHNISVPSIVGQKIATEILIEVTATLKIKV